MFKTSISFKLTSIVICTSILIIATVIGMSTVSGLNQLSESAKNYEMRIAGLLTDQNAGNIKFGRKQDLSGLFEQLAADEHFHLGYASAVRLDSTILAEKSVNEGLSEAAVKLAQAAIESSEPQLLKIENVQLIASPAKFGKKQSIVGAVVIGWDLSKEIAEAWTSAALASLVAIGVAALALLGLAIIIGKMVSRPLRLLSITATDLANDNYDIEVKGLNRNDELGDMSRAIQVFKENALRKQSLETEQSELKQREEVEQAKQQSLDETRTAERKLVADAFARAMAAIAAKDLSYRITEEFPESDQQLKEDFNQAISELSNTINGIENASSLILSGSREIHTAADNLAKRTENQAAAVEETAAALEETTVTMKSSTENAKEASSLVATTKDNAEKSGEIVQRAISAMNKIEHSADEIANIIGVIDDIAFQTNLLALNAGVEAARAGESGKGFAVVAQEVRELAQRSASAAKEIKQLITTSSEDVRIGANLVNETGSELETIVTAVKEIDEYVVAIVSAANEQSISIQEINQSIGNIDQGTQKNAAVAEESTAASYTLNEEVSRINRMLQEFTTAQDGKSRSKEDVATSPVAATSNDTPRHSPARELTQKVASSFGATAGNTALVDDEESWEEF